jgi:thiol-disulfide isomerase/thioredoxin
MLLIAGEGAELIGTAPPRWEVSEWVQGGPLAFESLRGRAVLIRWWTGPECPYCRSAVPRLNEWQERFGPRGLTVVGLYHHKSARPLRPADVSALATTLGIRFPVGIDAGWRTLRRWWLDGHERGFTSVTFLLDREGTIRFIHPGGSYSRSEAAALEAAIRKLFE